MVVSSKLLLSVCVCSIILASLVMYKYNKPITLLCSDGRCGESSRLSRRGAERDLNLWADKEELKNKLDELQTVMDRGMTHKSATQDLNQYFEQLDSQTRQQRQNALKQAQSEGLVDYSALSAHDKSQAFASKLASSAGNVVDNNHARSHLQSVHPRLKTPGAIDHGMSSSKLSSSAALADLNSYFDSLPVSRKHDEVCFLPICPVKHLNNFRAANTLRFCAENLNFLCQSIVQ